MKKVFVTMCVALMALFANAQEVDSTMTTVEEPKEKVESFFKGANLKSLKKLNYGVSAQTGSDFSYVVVSGIDFSIGKNIGKFYYAGGGIGVHVECENAIVMLPIYGEGRIKLSTSATLLTAL